MNGTQGRTLWWFSVGIVVLLIGFAVYLAFFA
jgi:hypothetical protein